jgi:hypothetical protein
MMELQKDKGKLLETSCRWIFNDIAFTNWRDNNDTQVLWIQGEPGKGKTMMMIALTEELSRHLKSNPRSGILSYFFCRSTHPELRTATYVLRGLIYLLIYQQKHLVQHLRERYDAAGLRLFEERSGATYALLAILSRILDDPSLTRVYLMIDALDECDFGLEQLLDFITENSSKLCKVKWLVSSRNRSDIEMRLRPIAPLRSKISLESDSNSTNISLGVKAFIETKVSKLANDRKYKSEVREVVSKYLSVNAKGTFLWVALVCKELQHVRAQRAISVLKTFPPELQPLYQRMMEQIMSLKIKEDVEDCKRILSSVTLCYRPIHLKELAAIAGLQDPNDLQSLNELVDLCGSFLTVREEVIDFVHQSAKDYLTSKGSQLFPLGQAEEHRKIGCRSLKVMSHRLKRDICDLQMPGALLDELSDVNQEPLAPIRYTCCYWVDHLQACHLPPEQVGLCDGGEVDIFLKQHFLHWLEALSLMRNMSSAVAAIRKLENLLNVRIHSCL